MISVITITKNNRDGFARTRASIEAQVFRDFEWVVIDGDAEPDAGIYDAMNKGIDRSAREYMIFMNAGDVFADPHVLSRLAPQLSGDFVYGDALEDGRYKRARHGIAYGMPTHHQAMIYRRGAWRYDIRYTIAADYKFTAQYWMNGTRRYLPFAICNFESGGISQRKTKTGRDEQAQIRRELGIFAPGVQTAQAIMAGIRERWPDAYWRLRQMRRSTSRV